MGMTVTRFLRSEDAGLPFFKSGSVMKHPDKVNAQMENRAKDLNAKEIIRMISLPLLVIIGSSLPV